MFYKNITENTFNFNLKKPYKEKEKDEAAKTLIWRGKEVKKLNDQLMKEPEIIKAISKKNIMECQEPKDKRKKIEEKRKKIKVNEEQQKKLNIIIEKIKNNIFKEIDKNLITEEMNTNLDNIILSFFKDIDIMKITEKEILEISQKVIKNLKKGEGK